MASMSRRFDVARKACYILAALIMVVSFAVFVIFTDALFKFTYVTDLLGTNVFTFGVLILVAVGLFAALLTPGILYSIVIQHSSMLAMLTFTCLTFACLSIMGAAFGFCLRSELSTGTLHAWMQEGLLNEYGHPAAYAVTHAWDRLQADLECCGVQHPEEWTKSDWFLGQVRFPRRRRPLSCCATCRKAQERVCNSSDADEEESSRDRATCTKLAVSCSDSPEDVADFGICTGHDVADSTIKKDAFVFLKGCYPSLESRLYLYSILMITGGILLGLLLFALSVSSLILMYSSDPYLTNYNVVQVGDE